MKLRPHFLFKCADKSIVVAAIFNLAKRPGCTSPSCFISQAIFPASWQSLKASESYTKKAFDRNNEVIIIIIITTVEPRLYGHQLSRLFDYPDFFSGPVFFMNINDLRC